MSIVPRTGTSWLLLRTTDYGLMTIPLTIVIFGASGDLTARKLMPSLYRLDRKGRLPEEARVVGVARSPFGDDAYREKLRAALRQFQPKDYESTAWDRFARRVF